MISGVIKQKQDVCSLFVKIANCLCIYNYLRNYKHLYIDKYR